MKKMFNNISGISKNSVYSIGKSFSYVEETLHGHVVKKYIIQQVVGKNDHTVGYKLAEFFRDVDEENWEEKGFKPMGGTTAVVKNKEVLEELLAALVPDETYDDLTVLHYHWVDVD